MQTIMLVVCVPNQQIAHVISGRCECMRDMQRTQGRGESLGPESLAGFDIRLPCGLACM